MICISGNNSRTLKFKVISMHDSSSAEQLQQIKQMMERSSRFVSLSGLSGIGAGVCALAGGWFASRRINCNLTDSCDIKAMIDQGGPDVVNDLLRIALITFLSAFAVAFLFTWLRSRQKNVDMTSSTTIRLFWNTAIPFVAGAVFLYRILQLGHYDLVAPGCLIFWGLSLVNA